MANGKPAGTAACRTRSTVLGAVLALLLAVTPFAAAQLLSGEDSAPHDPRTRIPPHGWPQRGQAALVLGNDRPAASPHQRPAPIASLAKVMTAYLTLKRYPLAASEDGFTITVTAAEEQAVAEAAARGESFLAVEAGERLSERQLLEALLIPSGNNIARILASRLAGSESRFLVAMNAEARALGMDHTTYTDPSGFDPGTVSTAADQLRVFRRAMRFPVFRQVVSMASVTLPVAGTVTNFNPLVAEGYAGKTGSHSAAGGCLAFFTEVMEGGRRLPAVGVVMGQGEGNDTSALLDAAAEAAEQLVASASTANHLHPTAAFRRERHGQSGRVPQSGPPAVGRGPRALTTVAPSASW